MTPVNDHDVRNPNAISEFRNLQLFETTEGIGGPSNANDLLTTSNGLPEANALLVNPTGF